MKKHLWLRLRRRQRGTTSPLGGRRCQRDRLQADVQPWHLGGQHGVQLVVRTATWYFAGGATNVQDNAAVVTADRMTFSTATNAATTTNLTVAKFLGASMSDGSSYGYFVAGANAAGALQTGDRP